MEINSNVLPFQIEVSLDGVLELSNQTSGDSSNASSGDAKLGLKVLAWGTLEIIITGAVLQGPPHYWLASSSKFISSFSWSCSYLIFCLILIMIYIEDNYRLIW